MLAIVSLVLGGVIYAVAYAARQTPATVAVTAGGAAMASSGGGIFTGGEPLSDQGRLTAGDFSSIFLQNWHEFFRWSNVDRVYLGVWSGLQAVSRALGVRRLVDGAASGSPGHRARRPHPRCPSLADSRSGSHALHRPNPCAHVADRRHRGCRISSFCWPHWSTSPSADPFSGLT